MKVLILTTSFPAYKGHLQSPFIYKLAEALSKNKTDVEVVCPFYKDSKSKEENWNGVKIHRFKYWPILSTQKLTEKGGIPSNLKTSLLAKIQFPFFLAAFLFKSMKHAKRCDVIHAQWSLSGLIGVLVKKIYKKPLILTERGASANIAIKKKYSKGILNWVLRRCDFVTANSENQTKMLSSLGVPKNKIQSVPNGIDIGMFKPRDKTILRTKLKIPSNKTIILFVGWLIERKGLKYLIDAMKIVTEKNKDVLLLVIGEGILEKKLKEQAQKSDSMKNVIFLGSKKPNEIPFFMNAADILVLPSLSEGKPNVVGEAMASGLAVIASDVNGTREFIDDGKDGFLVKPKDSRQIAERISFLVKNNNFQEEISKKARNSIIEKGLTWEKCARSYKEIYGSLA